MPTDLIFKNLYEGTGYEVSPGVLANQEEKRCVCGKTFETTIQVLYVFFQV